MKNLDIIKEQLEFLKSSPKLVMREKHWTKDQYVKTITDLEEQLKKSKKGKYRRSKGGDFERVIGSIFNKKFSRLRLSRTPMSGGFKKNDANAVLRGDLGNLNNKVEFRLHIECKDWKNWSMLQWIRQAEGDCPEGRIPCVISHREQKVEEGKRTQVAKNFITLPLEDFLEIVDENKIILEKRKNL